jgi:hypothetical protein
MSSQRTSIPEISMAIVSLIIIGRGKVVAGTAGLTSYTNHFMLQPSQDHTPSVSFNLDLTPSQKEARSQVPLPYTHEGDIISSGPPNIAGNVHPELF